MKHFRYWLWRLVLVVAVGLLASCSGSDDIGDANQSAAGSADPEVQDQAADEDVESAETATADRSAVGNSTRTNRWQLQALSPDGRSMLVSARAGGCTRHEGFVVETTDTEVRITAEASDPPSTGSCDLDFDFTEGYVELDAPLGDRRLEGCEMAECFNFDSVNDVGPITRQVLASERYVFRPAWPVTEVIDAGSGERIGDIPGALEAGVSGDLFVGVVFDSLAATTAIQPDTGEVVWARRGTFINADEDMVLIERSQIGALDAATGESLWSVDGLGTDVSTLIFSNSILLFENDTKRLVAVDRTTGEITASQQLGEDFVRMYGFDSGAVVVGGSQAVVFDTSGTEISRADGQFGATLSAVGTNLIVSDSIFQAAPKQEQDQSLRRRAIAAVGLESSDAVVLTAGRVALVDANTGDVTWSTPIGSAFEMSAALTEDSVIVSTALFVASLDRATGEMLWWIAVDPGPDAEVVTDVTS